MPYIFPTGINFVLFLLVCGEYNPYSPQIMHRILLSKLLDSFKGELTSSKWAKMAKCSQDTALRDIQGLIKLGILIQDTSGGRSTSYLLRA